MGAEFKELIYFSGTDKTKPTNPLCDITIMESINRLADLLNQENR